MAGLLRLTALCNAGVLMEYGESALLVDGVARDFEGFTGLPGAEFRRMLAGEGAYGRLCGAVFTHRHPDHCDEKRTALLRQKHPECPFFLPNEKTFSSGCIRCGPFSVSYCETPHMPQTLAAVRHFSLLVRAGDETVYFAGDAVPDAALHRQVLGGVRPAYVFVNPVYLGKAEIRALLSELAPRRIFVNHIPFDLSEKNSIRRKAERSIARYAPELPPLTLIRSYPEVLLEIDGRKDESPASGRGDYGKI